VLISTTAVAVPTAITTAVVWLAPTDDANGAQLVELSAIVESLARERSTRSLAGISVLVATRACGWVS
jgi:hypothetical protein